MTRGRVSECIWPDLLALLVRLALGSKDFQGTGLVRTGLPVLPVLPVLPAAHLHHIPHFGWDIWRVWDSESDRKHQRWVIGPDLIEQIWYCLSNF